MACPRSPICRWIALDLLLDDVDHGPGRAAAGDLEQEVLEHLLAVLGVHDLGVPLDPGQAAVDVLEGGDRRHRRGGQYVEAGWRCGHGVAVGHPHGVLGRDLRQQRAGGADDHRRAAVLRARRSGRTVRPERLGHQLEAVAHAEDRDPRGEDRVVDAWCALGVDRRRAAGQDDRLRLPRQHLGHRHRVRHDLGVDPGLAHPAGDQLGVLRPEVDHQDQIVLGVLRHGRSLSAAASRARERRDQRRRLRRLGTDTSAASDCASRLETPAPDRKPSLVAALPALRGFDPPVAPSQAQARGLLNPFRQREARARSRLAAKRIRARPGREGGRALIVHATAGQRLDTGSDLGGSKSAGSVWLNERIYRWVTTGYGEFRDFFRAGRSAHADDGQSQGAGGGVRDGRVRGRHR